MGWGSGRNIAGRRIGYNIAAICDHHGCSEVIDRGLAYVCGGMHDGGEKGCGKYFCYEHLVYTLGASDQLCDSCADQFMEDEPEKVRAALDAMQEALRKAA